MIDLNFKNKKIIFFSAHPDDEVAGAGGLLLKAREDGASIHLVLTIDPYEDRFDLDREVEQKTRLKEYGKTAASLSATYSYLGFSKYPTLTWQHIAPIIKEIREFKPDILIMLSSDERHTEHRQINEIVMQGVWHAGRDAFPEYGEKHKTTTMLEAEADNPMIQPNFLIDISMYMEAKKKLISGYESQIQRKDLVKAIEGLNAHRGHMYRKGDYAEAYKIKEFYYG